MVSTGRTFPTGVGAPILLEGLQVIGRVRPLLGHPQVSSIAPARLRPPQRHSTGPGLVERPSPLPALPDRQPAAECSPASHRYHPSALPPTGPRATSTSTGSR